MNPANPAPKVTLHNNAVLIERILPETKRQSGVVIPESVKDQPIEGYVVAKGKGKFVEFQDGIGAVYAPSSVRVGDHVIFDPYMAKPVKIDNREFVIVAQEDIYVTINE